MSDLVGLTPGRVAVVTLRRPERRNALNEDMLAALGRTLDDIAASAETRCVVLEGDGDHFCAGADFGDVAAGATEGVRYGAGFERLLRAIEAHPLPVVAKVQGAALGAGCQILAACDLAVAAEDARIGIPSARLGLLLDLEKIERLVRVFGAPVVREMLLAGRDWTGAEAAHRGLVALAVSRRDLAAAAGELAERVAACAPLSVRGSKAAIRTVLDAGALDRSADAGAFSAHDARALAALQSRDLAEGLAALREGRPPLFEGR